MKKYVNIYAVLISSVCKKVNRRRRGGGGWDAAVKQ